MDDGFAKIQLGKKRRASNDQTSFDGEEQDLGFPKYFKSKETPEEETI